MTIAQISIECVDPDDEVYSKYSARFDAYNREDGVAR